MELIETRLLGSELFELRALDTATLSAHTWDLNTEARLIEDNDRHYLIQRDCIVPVAYCDARDQLRHQAGLRLCCLIDRRGDILRLRTVECNGGLELDLQIGVDDRIVDQLKAQQNITQADTGLACAWLRDEFLLKPLDGSNIARAFVGDEGRNKTLRLIGRRREARLRESDGRWVIQQLTPVRRAEQAPMLLEGGLDFVPADAASMLQSPAQRRQFQEYLDAHGDYVDLWRRYASKEWERATESGGELGILHYKDAKPAGEEELEWRFEVDPEQATAFIERWRDLVGGDRQGSAPIEACAEPPAWMRNDQETGADASGKPVVGDAPRLVGDRLSLSYDPNRRHDAPPARGVLCLSVHGERKVHERRNQALERVRTGNNPMPQLHLLLEGQPVPMRSRWRKEPPLSRNARKAFRGTPTERQRQALDIALNTPDVAVVIGPPGTGKTQVIAALQRRVSEIFPDPSTLQYQFIITSFQHDAVDNALSRVDVHGLPPQRVGGRQQRADSDGDDGLNGWSMRQVARLEPRLAEAIASEPVFAALDALREDMLRLRIQPLTPMERAVLAHSIDTSLKQLEDQHGLRSAAPIQARWRDWLAIQTRPPSGEEAGTTPARKQWRRALWAVRISKAAFADDGARQCLRLIDLAKRLGQALSSQESALLDRLASAVVPTEEQLAALAALRQRQLTATRPDYRPPQLRNVLDREGCKVLDALVADLDARLRSRPQWAQLSAISDYLDDLRLDPRRVDEAVRAYTTVVGATCQQSASERMKQVLGLESKDDITFDTVVIDEAARATPLDLLIPMSMARRRIVLVGDHRQLPHLLDPATEDDMERAGDLAESERHALSESLFERLVERLRRLHREHPEQPQRVVTLDTQFRMHPVLGEFVSRTFYEAAGEEAIKSGRTAADFGHAVPGHEGKVCAWIDVPAGERHSRDRRTPSGSRLREVEAERIAREARAMLSACPDLSVGIITFYAAQRDLILERMAEHDLTEQHDGAWRIRSEWRRDGQGEERLCVGTVDAFQGKEFDIVLLSIVRTDAPLRGEDRERALTQKYGFLRLPNRLNVGMSRQQRLLIAVGDAALARAPEVAEAAPGLAAFMQLCEGPNGHVL